MSPKLRRLSGSDAISALERFGFVRVSQRGSHVKLKRSVGETMTVPLHRELDRGTTAAIFRQASRFINEAELQPYFYTD